jgi:hypothetical protein
MSKPKSNTTEVSAAPKAKAADAVTKLKPIVQVDWEDAWSNGDYEYSQDEIDERGPLICHSAGFLVRDDKSGVTLVTEIFDERNDPFRKIQHIPRGMIRKVTRLTMVEGGTPHVVKKRKHNLVGVA